MDRALLTTTLLLLTIADSLIIICPIELIQLIYRRICKLLKIHIERKWMLLIRNWSKKKQGREIGHKEREKEMRGLSLLQ
jgi:hypothetical protein